MFFWRVFIYIYPVVQWTKIFEKNKIWQNGRQKTKKNPKNEFCFNISCAFCQLLIFSICPGTPDTELVVKDCLQIWSHSDHRFLRYRGDRFEFVISRKTRLKFSSLITITHVFRHLKLYLLQFERSFHII